MSVSTFVPGLFFRLLTACTIRHGSVCKPEIPAGKSPEKRRKLLNVRSQNGTRNHPLIRLNRLGRGAESLKWQIISDRLYCLQRRDYHLHQQSISVRLRSLRNCPCFPLLIQAGCQCQADCIRYIICSAFHLGLLHPLYSPKDQFRSCIRQE